MWKKGYHSREQFARVKTVRTIELLDCVCECLRIKLWRGGMLQESAEPRVTFHSAASAREIVDPNICERALLNERAGVWYLVFSLVLALILFSYDMFVFEGFFHYYNALLFSVGYIIIFLLMGIALFYHLKIFKGDGASGTLTFDDLYSTESVKERG